MKRKLVTIEDERPVAAGSGRCLYCKVKIGEEHTNECVIQNSPSLWDENEPEAPKGWIQWKGTDVCIDLTCKCGEGFHFDGDFMYHIKCPYCGQVYECGAWIKLFPLDFEPDGTKEGER
jgi:hypothetical protein